MIHQTLPCINYSKAYQKPFQIAIIDKNDLTHLGNLLSKSQQIAQQILRLENLILRKQEWHSLVSLVSIT